MKEKKIQIGGQAVIEGVMMRGPDQIATAVRRKDGSIDLQKRPFISVTQTHPIWKLHIIRGFVSLIEMLIIGIKTLNFSGERYELDYTEKDTHEEIMLDTEKDQKKIQKRKKIYETLSIGLAFIGAFILFGYVPYFLSSLLQLSKNDIFFNFFAGIIRIVFFILYVYLISFMKEIRSVFEYHGAEHKAVYAHEQKSDLTIKNVQTFTTIHPRCGTSFMFLVLLIAILVFSLIDTIIAFYWGQFSTIATSLFNIDNDKITTLIGAFIRLLAHIPFLPLISGISYEIIKLPRRNEGNLFIKMITGPGMALQRITTKQPNDNQVETAIIALKAALNEDLSEFKNVNLVGY